jgi:hypothetical protein
MASFSFVRKTSNAWPAPAQSNQWRLSMPDSLNLNMTPPCAASKAAVDTLDFVLLPTGFRRGDQPGSTNSMNVATAGPGPIAFEADLKLCIYNTDPQLSPGFSFWFWLRSPSALS